MNDGARGMWGDDDVDQRIPGDDDVELALAQAYAMRPVRQAWRTDLEEAPLSRPVYARETDSIRVIIAMHDEAGWVVITRDGECRPTSEVAAWAPLLSALA